MQQGIHKLIINIHSIASYEIPVLILLTQNKQTQSPKATKVQFIFGKLIGQKLEFIKASAESKISP